MADENRQEGPSKSKGGKNLRNELVLMGHSVLLIHCPSCQRPATTWDDYNQWGRQRDACRPCHLDFTAYSTLAFLG